MRFYFFNMHTIPPPNHSPCSEKQQKILDAATEIFLQHGFNAATTDMIQKKAGVSKATLYALFANKQVLFSAVIEHQCALMVTFLNSIELNDSKVEATLKAIGMIYLKFILSPAGIAIYRLCIAEAARFPDLSHVFYKAGPQKTAQVVAQYLAHAVDSKEISMPAFGLEQATALFLSMLRGDMHVEYLTHPQAQASEVQIEKWTETVVRLFLHGVLKA